MSRQGNRNTIARLSRFLSSRSLPTHLGLAALVWLGGVGAMTAHAQFSAPAAAPLTTVATTVIYVNPLSGNDQPSAGKNEAAPYKTISFALQQAGPGTVIQLSPGTYSLQSNEKFPLMMKPGVILRGDESSKGATTILNGSGGIISKTFAGQNVTVLMANGSELRGVTVTNAASRGTAVWVEDCNPTIANNTLAQSVREGIFVTSSVTPANPVIENNLFTKNQGNGISVAKTAQGQIRDNQFIDTGFGLAIGGTSAPVITNNQIVQNTAGLFISDNSRPVLRNNTIVDNKTDGIVATSSAQPDLGTTENAGNNTIRNNKQFDLNNGTKNRIVAIGNNIDPKKINGPVDFVASSGGSTFSDVQGHWAQAYIQALASQNIITGFPDGTFKPNDPVTRAQFAAIILKAFNPAPKRAGIEFSDVPSKYWGYAAIQAAAKGGFVSGYPGGLFKPEERIPKVQSLVALANGLEFGQGNTALLSKYQDAASIPNYAKALVAAATQRQIVVNYPTVGQLEPNRQATRAEVAAFIYQALVSSGKAQAIPSPYIVSGN